MHRLRCCRYERQLAAEGEALARTRGEKALLQQSLATVQHEAASHADVVGGLRSEAQRQAEVRV